jgi:hypothetical protein
MKDIIIKSYSQNDIRFASVWKGRLFTLILQRANDNEKWYFTSFDPELNKNMRKLQVLTKRLLEDEKVVNYMKNQNIDIHNIHLKLAQ